VNADLVVGRTQARRVLRPHRSDELALAQREKIFSVAARLRNRLVLPRIADIEIGERQRARARRPGHRDFGVKREQRRRKIAAERGEADAAAFRRHVADVAGGFQAMAVGLAPPFALIVEDAAGIERKVAAERPHVAMGRSGNVTGRLRDDGIMPRHVRVVRNVGQRRRRADLERLRVRFDGAQLNNIIDVDQHRRGDDASSDIDQEIGAAGDELAVAVSRARLAQFVERPRTQQIE